MKQAQNDISSLFSQLVLLEESGHFLTDPRAHAEASQDGGKHLQQPEAHLALGLLQNGAARSGRRATRLPK